MFIWNHPTTVHAGSAASDPFAAHTRALARNVAVIADANVLTMTPLVETLRIALASAGVSTKLAEPVRSAPTPVVLHELREQLSKLRPDAVLAIGGGATLDTAKLVAAAMRTPACLSPDVLTAANGGLVELPLEGRFRPPHVFAVPTTIGTGSEVSASACVDLDDAKVLVQHPLLRPAIALIDPLAVATTPVATVFEGALEVLLRCIGPVLGETTVHEVQNRTALAVAAGVVADGCGLLDGDDSARHRLALASAQSHTGWLMTGRAPYAHMLWFLASEVAHALGITKMAATSGLLSTYVAWLEAGRVPGALAAPAVGGIFDQVFAGRFDQVSDLLRAWKLPAALPPSADPDHLAVRTHALWNHRPDSLRGWTPQTLARFYREACQSTSSLHSISIEGGE